MSREMVERAGSTGFEEYVVREGLTLRFTSMIGDIR